MWFRVKVAGNCFLSPFLIWSILSDYVWNHQNLFVITCWRWPICSLVLCNEEFLPCVSIHRIYYLNICLLTFIFSDDRLLTFGLQGSWLLGEDPKKEEKGRRKAGASCPRINISDLWNFFKGKKQSGSADESVNLEVKHLNKIIWNMTWHLAERKLGNGLPRCFHCRTGLR